MSVIVISGFADPATVEAAFARGAAAVFDKSFDIGFLALKVREILKPGNYGCPPHRPTGH